MTYHIGMDAAIPIGTWEICLFTDLDLARFGIGLEINLSERFPKLDFVLGPWNGILGIHRPGVCAKCKHHFVEGEAVLRGPDGRVCFPCAIEGGCNVANT